MKFMVKILAVAVLATTVSACNGLTKSQRNTAIGAAVGGVAGNMIGNSTGATLGGAALGGVIGSQIK
ncbi:glycine zipper 2TM domain-containing protein [Actinobacillus capsulatus]|uniref:glycine zipper 2TM domain-containing protein n=1 Tax=Actinobacillus capsulatus TaxID=717 RepID=UPI00036EB596|nr:glycine zipper 2TM domain-containing protein [Actinobacillus capsulatus]